MSMANRNLTILGIFVGLIVMVYSHNALPAEVKFNNITFKIIKTFDIYVDKNGKLAKKEGGEDNSTFHMISGLSSENIKILVFRDNKVIWEDKLTLLSRSRDGTIYLCEKTGANYINLWTIFPESKTVVCTKQYNEIDGRVRIANYISIIESAY